MRDEAEKAELLQSIQAYYIPASLFLATLITSAGIFLIYNGYALGYLLAGVGVTIMVSAFVIFVRFQNKLRVNGQIARKQDGYVMTEEEEESPNHDLETTIKGSQGRVAGARAAGYD